MTNDELCVRAALAVLPTLIPAGAAPTDPAAIQSIIQQAMKWGVMFAAVKTAQGILVEGVQANADLPPLPSAVADTADATTPVQVAPPAPVPATP